LLESASFVLGAENGRSREQLILGANRWPPTEFRVEIP
jgi:hypothetical protein